MPIRREFLGTERPTLVAAADLLLERYRHQGVVRMADVIVVLPSSRAGRRLLEILVQQCEERDLVLEPPLIETIGAMPEQLYEVKKPLANDLTQQLAWAEALRNTKPDLLKHVVPHPPPRDHWQRWMELGELLRTQHRELASDCLNFAGVLKGAKGLPGFDEAPRWRALADVQERYLRLLDSLNVWDLQTARLYAIEHRECQTDRDFVLVAVADLNRAMRAMLDLVADRVTVLVAAPEKWADRFDEHGCLIPEAWLDVPMPIDDGTVRRVDTPADQAYEVAQELARYDGRYRADEVSIGLADPSLAPQIARQLSEFGVATRYVNSRQVKDSRPYRLLATVAEYLRTPTFASFAALVRHPDVYDWLQTRGADATLLTQLDELQVRRLPTEFVTCESWISKRWGQVASALTAICEWLLPLRQPDKPLHAWSESVQGVLIEVYRHRAFDKHDRHDSITLAALEQIRQGLAGLGDVPERLVPTTSAASALQVVLEAIGSELIPPPASPDAIEMLGWLELPLDDAPALIVTSFNEGYLPSSRGADMFLPNRLRKHLGLNDSDRLYARDAYFVCLVTATRQEVTWIVGRQDVERNPLAPSRLLFATDLERIAVRAKTYFGEFTNVRPRLLLGGAFVPRVESRLEVPPPEECELPQYLRVTDFRSYLACPYRFYLRRILQLASLSDEGEELDALQFGNLLHDVLQQFGNSAEAKSLDDESRLADWLTNELYRIARDELGERRRPAVNVQLEQLRLRLTGFARWQAEHTRDGWQIVEVEQQLAQELQFGEYSVVIQGRIDRIDYHPDRNEWLVLDYKSGDGGLTPDKTHRVRKEWVDLQLPLYRRMFAAAQQLSNEPRVGYVLLPREVKHCGAALADWQPEDWQSADAKAAEVVAAIMSRTFWPPTYGGLPDEELSPICQDLVAGRRLGTTAKGAIA